MRTNRVKKELKAGRSSIGTWLSLASITAARFMARAGFDWLTVDMEHSLVGWETTAHILSSIADAGCTALARVPANRHDHIKRALDNGAHGIVVPMVNSRDEAVAAVAACRYPPAGIRSVGGSVHALNFGASAQEYFGRANDEILVVLQCEHIRAVEDADQIFSVPGIDAIFVGPNDLAASMRGPDGSQPNAVATADVMRRIFDACRKHGVAPGLHCATAEEARARREEGWQFLAIGSELRMMLDGAEQVLQTLGKRQAEVDIARY